MINLQIEKATEKYPENTNTTQKKIINLVRSNNRISREEIAKITGLSLEGIKKNIKLLKQKGLIERIGPDKGGYWKVK